MRYYFPQEGSILARGHQGGKRDGKCGRVVHVGGGISLGENQDGVLDMWPLHRARGIRIRKNKYSNPTPYVQVN